jgi:type VI secretion system secreted protein VgrG
VINAPDGVSVSSPQAVRIASGAASVGIMSQKNTDISALKDFTVAAGQAVSLFARKTGMKLFAAGGKLQLWAQNDAIEATAKQDITLTSVEGRIELAAETELVISCGGSYIKLAGGNIELGCPNNILLKSTNVQKMSKSDYRVPPVKPPRGFQGKFTLRCHTTNEPMPHIYYRLTTAEGEVYSGVTDASGHTMIVYTNMPDSIDIELTENQGE